MLQKMKENKAKGMMKKHVTMDPEYPMNIDPTAEEKNPMSKMQKNRQRINSVLVVPEAASNTIRSDDDSY